VIALAFGVLALVGSASFAGFVENFDGAGTVPYTLTSSSGTASSIQNGGPTGNYLRVINLNGSNNNSIAFDEHAASTGPQPGGIKLAFDFRMTDDAANAAAGGCCGSAADGIGVGLFATAQYGTTGGVNPGGMGLGDWERPAFPNAFAVGMDIFQNIDEVTLNWNDVEVAVANVQPIMDLNDGVWHRAVVSVTPNGSDATVDMLILEDLHGITTVHNIFSGQTIPGLDLSALPGWRLIAGGRTGGAFAAGSIDNIALQAVPEPTSVALLGLGGLLLLAGRRRR
jgi:hypothetical protein